MSSTFLGMELCVGKEPPALTPNIILDFNEIFLKMFQAFDKNPRNRVVLAQWESTDEDGDLNFGSFTLSRVWKRLAYHQMVQASKTTEHTGRLNEETKKPKMRTVTIIEPTKIGYEILEKGAVFSFPLWDSSRQIPVGLGKPYPTFKQLWNKLETMFVVAHIAKTRQEKWFYEFKEFFITNLANKRLSEAEEEVVEFGRIHIASAPKRRFKELKVKNDLEPSARLDKWFS